MAKETEFDRFDRRKRLEKKASLQKKREIDEEYDFEYVDKKKGGKNKGDLDDIFPKKRFKKEIFYDSEYESVR